MPSVWWESAVIVHRVRQKMDLCPGLAAGCSEPLISETFKFFSTDRSAGVAWNDESLGGTPVPIDRWTLTAQFVQTDLDDRSTLKASVVLSSV
jgi:hypothetical protein